MPSNFRCEGTIQDFLKENDIPGIAGIDTRALTKILRAKGMVAGKNGEWIYFDMVPEEADVREGAPEYTGRICVIGSKLKEDKLEELFA